MLAPTSPRPPSVGPPSFLHPHFPPHSSSPAPLSHSPSSLSPTPTSPHPFQILEQVGTFLSPSLQAPNPTCPNPTLSQMGLALNAPPKIGHSALRASRPRPRPHFCLPTSCALQVTTPHFPCPHSILPNSKLHSPIPYPPAHSPLTPPTKDPTPSLPHSHLPLVGCVQYSTNPRVHSPLPAPIYKWPEGPAPLFGTRTKKRAQAQRAQAPVD